MTFEILNPTDAKLTEYIVLSDKDRAPDTNPGAAVSFTLSVPNEVLSDFDGLLRGMIFCKNANSAGGLEGIATDLPNLTAIGKALGEFGWDLELTGYTLTFDYGLAGNSNFNLTDCKLLAFRLQGKEGGTTILKLKVETPDANATVHSKLAFLKSQAVKIILRAPVVVEQPADDAPRKSGKQTAAQGLGAALGQTH